MVGKKKSEREKRQKRSTANRQPKEGTVAASQLSLDQRSSETRRKEGEIEEVKGKDREMTMMEVAAASRTCPTFVHWELDCAFPTAYRPMGKRFWLPVFVFAVFPFFSKCFTSMYLTSSFVRLLLPSVRTQHLRPTAHLPRPAASSAASWRGGKYNQNARDPLS
ncbi:MAG: hypothetical protein CME32_08330 [Gimesia sp.]|nr:hypothetical protein [Gimesia sp.]